MKTLYEVLEVSEKASKEIIEKAYRVLAKKYHPDLKQGEEKLQAEKQMKEINEAYSTLSDDAKRQEYDKELAIEREKQEEANRRMQEAEAQIKYEQARYTENSEREKYVDDNIQRTYNQDYSVQDSMTEAEYKEVLKRQQEILKKQEKMQRDVQAEYEKKYQKAYEGYLKSLGFRIKRRWTWKRVKDLIITIIIIIAICMCLWFFPPTNKMIMDFYNSNSILKTIVDIIISIFKGIWNAISSLFTKNKI